MSRESFPLVLAAAVMLAVTGCGSGGDPAARGRSPPQDLRSWHRCHDHRLNLDIGACLISIDLQEDVADAKSRALAVGNDDLDLLHVGHHHGTSTALAGCASVMPVVC